MSKEKKICSVDGCGKKHEAFGLCNKHYKRFKKHGDPLYVREKMNSECLHEECKRKATSKGYCHMHYLRALRHGDSRIVKKYIKHCTIDGCNNKHVANGYCHKHYKRVQMHGDPNYSEQELHGLRNTSEYTSWKCMKERCFYTKHVAYDRYGGRGITVCDRWKKSFLAFYEDMGKKPEPFYQIDRIDNDGNYEPDNCRWVTPSENCKNRG